MQILGNKSAIEQQLPTMQRDLVERGHCLLGDCKCIHEIYFCAQSGSLFELFRSLSNFRKLYEGETKPNCGANQVKTLLKNYAIYIDHSLAQLTRSASNISN